MEKLLAISWGVVIGFVFAVVLMGLLFKKRKDYLQKNYMKRDRVVMLCLKIVSDAGNALYHDMNLHEKATFLDDWIVRHKLNKE